MKRALLVILIILSFSISSSARVNQLGDITSSFEVTDGTDKTYKSYLGQYVIIDAIMTSCSYCIKSTENLRSAYQEYSEQVSFISVGVFNASDNLNTITDFMQKYGGDWIFGMDDGTLKDELDISFVPITFLFSTNGDLVETLEGQTEYEELKSAIETKLLSNSSIISSATELNWSLIPGITLFQSAIMLGIIVSFRISRKFKLN
ncbi:MAG: TlpA family protein disulfide reductase [Candidatus Heimdallarchaeota archaeon]|nr:TlpA family protein disulfide reductase [Candidatus Heimdallarchaeota archaeon]